MRKIVSLLPCLLLLVGFTGNAEQNPPEVTGLDDLAQEEGLFDLTLVNPATDFSVYDKLYAKTVVVKFERRSRTQDHAPTGSLIRERRKSRPFPDDEDRQLVNETIAEGLTSGLVESRDLELVDSIGPGTLVLRAAVVDIAARPPSRAERSAGVEVPSLTAGTIVFDLIDGGTGVIQARVAERRMVPEPAPETIHGDAPLDSVVAWARSAARDLLAELERVRAESDTT